MANQKVLEEYLIGNNKDNKGYLRRDDNNGKVIMLSGKWGSGKTHFWQEKIATNELKEELKKEEKCYSYVSLYGKSSIEEIENDIFSQVYFDSVGGENLVTKTASTFTKLTKRYGKFSSLLDFSKLAEATEKQKDEFIENSATKRLENGGIICFDDFERKSKEIDLNDLFGFITQLSLNFQCKIVIILNDDVFEGKEKDIFSNVKEKTVSKYLYYNPSIRELFKLIFLQKKNKSYKYTCLRKHMKLILNTIEETEELNARIYIQVLDNLLEWIEKTNEDEHSDEILRCLILVNVIFILYHSIVIETIGYEMYGENKVKYKTIKGVEEGRLFTDIYRNLNRSENKSKNTLIDELIYDVSNRKLDNKSESKVEEEKKLILNNKSGIYAVYTSYKLHSNFNVKEKELEKINNFIETGILIKDENK